MAEYINLDTVVTAQFYDDEHEEWTTERVTVRDYLLAGCEVIPNDTVNIVRCRDCKVRFNRDICSCKGPDWFCGYGKRREDSDA